MLRKGAEQAEKALHSTLVGGREAIGSQALEKCVRALVRSVNDERLFRGSTLPFLRSLLLRHGSEEGVLQLQKIENVEVEKEFFYSPRFLVPPVNSLALQNFFQGQTSFC